ncbi:hypothetical protein BGZ63DRAFT_445733 [Mariannaea sp. PMI_226]|nr:hypothetical protein BGZ63DRAFT_445733 [Mariannaea sp. PMI_226]
MELSIIRQANHGSSPDSFDDDPSAPKEPKTFRVRGVPRNWNLNQLQIFLRESVSFSPLNVMSLAPEVHGRTQSATIVFPDQQPPRELKSWRIPFLAEGQPQNRQRRILELDTEFLGMTTFYDPRPGQYNVDIVAISGLGGHAIASFKEKGGDHMWIRDSLPVDIPTARIMVYGYRSNVAGSKSMQNLEDLATSFYTALLPLADCDVMRPIILIAHGLGGLIVKQALVILSESKNETLLKLSRAVCGIAFFGVPHHGMAISSLVPMIGNRPNRFLVESLNFNNSQILSTLHRAFHHALDGEGEAQIVCFYETELSPTAIKDKDGAWKMTGPETVLVSKVSATHCRPWEEGPEYICSVARSHSSMVRFGLHDDEYEKVRARIKEMTRTARIRQPSSNNKGT